MSNYGRETITLVEIDQPFCTRIYGDAFHSPTGGCTAQLGVDGARKCYNTKATCQDPANYNPGILTLRFGRDQEGLLQYGSSQAGSPVEPATPVIPCVRSVQTTPARINLAAMDRSASPLGQREVVTVEMDDFQHSDLLLDKYRLERITGEAGMAEYLSLPGVSGNQAQTADVGSPSGALDVVGDIDIRMRVAMNDWTPGAVSVLASKAFTGPNQQAWFFYMDATNRLTLGTSSDGTLGALVVAAATEALPVQDGATIWLRATRDVDDGESPANNRTAFYVSQDGETWVQLGAEVVNSGSTSIFNSNAALMVGASDAGTFGHWAGRAYRLQLYDGIDGTLVADFDPSLAPYGATSFVDALGNTWTIDQSGAAPAELLSDGFDPFTRGTFWGKWLARNPFHANYNCRVREGYLGDSLDDMRVRRYVVDRIDGPQGGGVRLTAKDEFSRIEARKSVAPRASRGELAANITAVAASATLLPSGIGTLDYPFLPGSPSELYVAIGDEMMKCTRSGDTLTFTQRGALGTTAAAHSQEDLVQWVLVYNAQACTDIVYDLLTEYSDIDPALIDLAAWEAEASELTSLYTARIAEPTAVNTLIGELAEQAGFTLWPDPVTGMIQFKALRAATPTPTVDDDAWLVEGSFSSRLDIAKRLSQVWVYYGQVNPLEDLDERRNYRSRLLVVDLTAEGAQEYGTPSIREVFSRWIPQFGAAQAEEAGNRILAMFRDPPLDVEFRLHASRDGEIDLAQLFFLETAEIQDVTGAALPVAFAATQVARGENEISLRGMQVELVPPATDTGERVIHIENDDFNLNLRSVHDSLYEALVGGSPTERVRFVLDEGIVVGSTSTGSSAIRTGSWPEGVQLTLENHGRIQGKGGAGGNGYTTLYSNLTGRPGGVGGTALLVENTLLLDNGDGQIWGGGGGGGGGGSGSGGGGGAGTEGGAGGAPTPGSGSIGASGTATAGGAGGSGGGGGNGGDGGGPGLNGSAGSPAGAIALGGAGGTRGKYIDGIANVTWVGSPNGDLRGGVA